MVIPMPGGPDIFEMREQPCPLPKDANLRISICFAGINWGDIQKRQGIYPNPISYPVVIGLEVSGYIESCSPSGVRLQPSQRVAAITGPQMLGGHADSCLVPQDYVIPIPDSISLETAAAMPAACLTAWHLLHTAHGLKQGDIILMHAAGGAVGLAVTQLALAKAAMVIGTVGSAAKARGPAEYGAAAIIDRSREDFVTEALRLTSGRGVDLVIDSLGADSLERSFDALAAFGKIINIGEAAGEPDFPIRKKLYEKSTSLQGFEFLHARPGSSRWRQSVNEICQMVSSGRLKVPVESILPLTEAAKAHRLLESRTISGKILLKIPND